MDGERNCSEMRGLDLIQDCKLQISDKSCNLLFDSGNGPDLISGVVVVGTCTHIALKVTRLLGISS